MRNKQLHLHPATFYFVLLMVVTFVSWIGSIYDWKAIHPATQEVIEVRNLLSAEYARGLLLHVFDNFASFSPLGAVVICMLGVGVADHSGFIQAVIYRFFKEKMTQKGVLLMVIFIGVFSNVLSDTGYILLLPIAAVLFRFVHLHPLGGVVIAYVSVSCGFSANVFFSTLDPLISSITQDALSRMIATNEAVGPLSNFYFMFVSSFVVAGVIYWISNRWLLKQMTQQKMNEMVFPVYKLLSHKEKRALFAALFVGGGYFLVILFFTFSPLAIFSGAAGILSHSPFATGAVFLLSVGFGLMGGVYGLVSGRYLSDRDVVNGLMYYGRLLINFLVIAFFAALMIEGYRYTHLDRLAVLKLAEYVPLFPEHYVFSLFSFVVMVAFANLFILSATSKWKLLAYLFLPFFSQIGGSASEVQCAFRIGDSLSNVLTPFLVFTPFLLAYMQYFDHKAGFGTLLRLTWRFTFWLSVTWLLFFIVWILLALPLGY